MLLCNISPNNTYLLFKNTTIIIIIIIINDLAISYSARVAKS